MATIIAPPQSTLTPEETAELQVIMDPVQWSDIYLNWKPFDYQPDLMYGLRDNKRVVFRLGRRLGKTEILCIMILWYAFTQYNRSPTLREDEDKYKILIICPFEEQVDLIFERLNQLIDASPVLSSVKRRVHHRIEFWNGTAIKGMTAGSKSNTGAAGTRGQYADVLVTDEVDYMADNDITNIINIANEDPARIKIFAASTPTGKRGPFYRWCTGKIKGWKAFHLPSTVNKRLLEMNPDTGQSYLEDLKEELTDLRYLQEVMAEFGEEQAGVYQKRFIDLALKLGKIFNLKYYDERNLPPAPAGPRILGVDWDKVQATPNLVGLEFDTTLGMFKVIFRKEIPRHEFTLTLGVNAIINSDKLFRWDWIFVDRGMGEMQVEQLHLHGIRTGNKEFSKKVIGVSFSEKVKVRDPHTRKVVKKPVKPFMVNYSVNQFEKQHIAFPWDRKLVDQLENYYIKNVSPNGMPTYTDENEHIVDALNLCFLGFALKYDDMIKQKAGWGFKKIDNLDTRNGDIKDRTTMLEKGYKESCNPNIDPTRDIEIRKLRSRATKGRGGWSSIPSRSNLR